MVQPSTDQPMDTLNPYSPPKSSVAEAEIRTNVGEKPRSAKIATVLLWTAYGVGALYKLFKMFQGEFPYGLPVQTGILAYAAVELVSFWFTWKLTSGRNWARIVWIVFFLLGMVGTAFAWQAVVTAVKANPWLFAEQTMIGVVVLVLLLMPSTARWYKGT